MANSFFQFKQFRIEQGSCGMKVTTDACLFGAIVSDSISKNKLPNNILDIGAGTGLLSLMLAQVSATAKIKAVEIDEDTYRQAGLNFKSSPWSDNLSIEHTSFQDLISESKFDVIISNPPFFWKNQRGNSSQKNLAVHNESLSIDQLAQGISQKLQDDGLLFLLYPPHEMGLFIEKAKELGLFAHKTILIKDMPNKPVIRKAVTFSRVEMDTQTSELVIKQENGKYTKAFIDLLKTYYLHL